ncbi:hypothetical protein ACX9R5_01695 [Rathayibacter sp. CAU 1779]
MSSLRRTLRARSRRATILLWSVAAVALALSAAVIAFTTSQQMHFYQAQTAQGAVGVRPSFWVQVSWAIQGLPAVFLMVGLACAVAPFFLFAITAQRRVAADEDAEAVR